MLYLMKASSPALKLTPFHGQKWAAVREKQVLYDVDPNSSLS